MIHSAPIVAHVDHDNPVCDSFCRCMTCKPPRETPHPLLNAPPRLSDLRGEELRRALAQRHVDNRENWLATRNPQGLLARVRAVLSRRPAR